MTRRSTGLDYCSQGGADLAKLEVINPGENDYSAAVKSILGTSPDVI
jgi:hypothetical protein